MKLRLWRVTNKQSLETGWIERMMKNLPEKVKKKSKYPKILVVTYQLSNEY